MTNQYPDPFATAHRRNRPGKALPIAIIAACALAVTVVLAATHLLQPLELDKGFCPIGHAPHAHTLFLVDLTDPLTQRQAATLSDIIGKRRSELAIGDRLSLILLYPGHQAREQQPTPALVEPVFSVCRPANGEDVNPSYRNPAHASKRYTAFMSRVKDGLAWMKQPRGSAPNSPIIEALHWIGHTAVGFTTEVVERKLVLVSDMLQNSDLHSHYRDDYDFARFARGESVYLDPGALRGAQVQVYRIAAAQRKHEKNQKKAWGFWEDYFAAIGMRVKRLIL